MEFHEGQVIDSLPNVLGIWGFTPASSLLNSKATPQQHNR